MQDNEGTFQLGKLILQDIPGEDYSSPGIVIHEHFWNLAKSTRDKLLGSWANALDQIQIMSDEHESNWDIISKTNEVKKGQVIEFPKK